MTPLQSTYIWINVAKAVSMTIFCAMLGIMETQLVRMRKYSKDI